MDQVQHTFVPQVGGFTASLEAEYQALKLTESEFAFVTKS